MHIEPDFEQRPDAKMLAQPGQRGFLLLEQSHDLFARFGIAAARQGQGAERRRRRAARIAAAQARGDIACEGIFLERRRSEEHTSELQSLMRISYAVFCLKKKKRNIRPLS